MRSLIGYAQTELERLAETLGEPHFRGRQIAHWMYQRAAASFDEMTDLPKALRARLSESYEVRAGRIAGRLDGADGTVKLALLLSEDSVVECVLIPGHRRATICVSTQVGCPVGCAFCATGRGGLERNLDWREIIEQVLAAAAVWREGVPDPPDLRQAPLNVVYMGMGEPFLNYRATLRSIHFLRDEIGLGSRSITVSTVGIPDAIRQFAHDEPQVNLAISLAAPTDELRAELIPKLRGKGRHIAEVMAAARDYLEATNRRLSFEYVLLKGTNVRARHAHKLADLLKALGEGLPSGTTHVNLIPYNEAGGPFERPSEPEVARFLAILEQRGVHATVRASRGDEIAGACGQLRGSLAAAIASGEISPEPGRETGSGAGPGHAPRRR
jgi:23S rRNA (adenine2503-C2)-methyltransferase